MWNTLIQMSLVTFFTSEDAILIRRESGTNIGKSHNRTCPIMAFALVNPDKFNVVESSQIETLMLGADHLTLEGGGGGGGGGF